MTSTIITATRYHDFSAGHRVVGHESKCKYLHGHNYRVHFTCAGELDAVGRVIDFGVIKNRLCQWLENSWDHMFLIKEDDPVFKTSNSLITPSLVRLPFNPTAENMALYLGEIIAPSLLLDIDGLECIRVVVEETRKCKATWAKGCQNTWVHHGN